LSNNRLGQRSDGGKILLSQTKKNNNQLWMTLSKKMELLVLEVREKVHGLRLGTKDISTSGRGKLAALNREEIAK